MSQTTCRYCNGTGEVALLQRKVMCDCKIAKIKNRFSSMSAKEKLESILSGIAYWTIHNSNQTMRTLSYKSSGNNQNIMMLVQVTVRSAIGTTSADRYLEYSESEMLACLERGSWFLVGGLNDAH